MKILITGVKGFMGTNFAEHYLSKTDYEVIGVSRRPDLPAEHKILDNLGLKYGERFSFQPCDITDSGRLKLIFDNARPDIILNFASQADVAESFIHPYAFFRSNLEGVVHMLEWLRHSGKGTRMVHFSTEAVFSRDGMKSTENDALYPKNPYAASKAAAEQYVQAYNFCFDTNVQIARPSNNYGPYQNPNKIIAKTIINCIEDKPFKMYPETKPQKRNWLYVKDTCRAVDFILDSAEKDGVYNIVSDDELTTNEAVMKILDTFGKRALMQGYLESRFKDEEHYNLDGAKLRGLGWKPKSGFDEGIKATEAWFKENASWFAEGSDRRYR